MRHNKASARTVARIWLALLGCLVLPVGDAAAELRLAMPEGLRKVMVTPNGACPPEGVIRNVFNNVVRNAQFGAGTTFVLRADSPLIDSAYPGGVVLPDKIPLFGRVNVMAWFDLDPDRRLALVRYQKANSETACGWIDRSYLLLPDDLQVVDAQNRSTITRGPMPKLVRDIPALGKARGGGDHLSLKVVMQNATSDSRDSTIPVYAGPSLSSPRLKPVPLRSTYDVFKLQETEENRVTSRFYLIGNKGDSVTTAIRGWVLTDQTLPWPTRMAVSWAGTGEAEGTLGQNTTSGQPDIREPKGYIEAEDAAAERFPVLAQDPPPEDVARKLDGNRGAAQANRLVGRYQVAVPAYDPDYARRLKELESAQDSLRTIDIQFVIDMTESMEPYWPATARAVTLFVRRFSEKLGKEINVHLGAIGYGDYKLDVAGLDDTKLQFLPLVEMTAGTPAVSEFGRLLRQKSLTDPQKDYPEASLAALIRAAETRGTWRPDAATRMLIHIGDHGARSKDATSGQGSRVAEPFDATAVADRLAAANIGYVAVAVRGGKDNWRQRIVHNQRFVSDGQGIVTHLRAANSSLADRPVSGRTQVPTADPEITYNQETGDEAAESLEERIYAAISRTVDLALASGDALSRKIACIQRLGDQSCRESATRSADPTAIYAERKAEEILTGDIRNLLAKQVSVGSYWFKPLTQSGKDVFRYWIALDPTDAENLTAAMEKSCTRFGTTGGSSLYDIWATTLRLAAKEGDDGTLASKRLSIPAYFLSANIGKKFDDLEADIEAEKQQPQAVSRLRLAFCRSAKLLSGIKGSRKYVADGPDGLKWNERDGSFDAGKYTTYNWTYTSPSGVKFVNVPLDYLP